MPGYFLGLMEIEKSLCLLLALGVQPDESSRHQGSLTHVPQARIRSQMPCTIENPASAKAFRLKADLQVWRNVWVGNWEYELQADLTGID